MTDGGQCHLRLKDAQDISFCPLSHIHPLQVHKEQAYIKKQTHDPNEKSTLIANVFIQVNVSFTNLMLSVYKVPETLGTREIDEVRYSPCLKGACNLFGDTELKIYNVKYYKT